jgi:FAD/FMN-containing dehydrogenase
MSRRQVQRYIEARNEADVLEAFQLAQHLGIPITARGKAHAMGGHSMGPGIVLSLRHMSHVAVDVEGGKLTAQAGATWAEVLQAANRHARSVPTLQSYAGFSLGGSIAVNIHGVSSDATLAESILALRVLTADGRVLDCPHPSLQEDQEAETAVLFRHVVGGLGLCGIVLSVTLRLCSNVLLDSDTMLLTPAEFDHVHTQVREAPDVELKLARYVMALPTST